MHDVFQYDDATGNLIWKPRPNRNAWNAAWAGKVAGRIDDRKSSGYVCTKYCGKTLRLHRVVWFLFHNEWPDGEIDHINGNRADNRIENLRLVDACGNSRNRKIPSTNKSGVMGVYLHKQTQKWRANIRVGGKIVCLGLHATIEAASRARRDAELAHGYHHNHGRAA